MGELEDKRHTCLAALCAVCGEVRLIPQDRDVPDGWMQLYYTPDIRRCGVARFAGYLCPDHVQFLTSASTSEEVAMETVWKAVKNHASLDLDFKYWLDESLKDIPEGSFTAEDNPARWYICGRDSGVEPDSLTGCSNGVGVFTCLNCDEVVVFDKMPRSWRQVSYKPYAYSPAYKLGYLCSDCNHYLDEGNIDERMLSWVEKRKKTNDAFREAMELLDAPGCTEPDPLGWTEKRMKSTDGFLKEAEIFEDDRTGIKVYPTKMGEIHEPDMVNHPPHYTQGGIECIDAIEASMSAEEFAGYLKGNVMKYLWRYRNKGRETEDLSKAQWYLNKLTEKADKEQ